MIACHAFLRLAPLTLTILMAACSASPKKPIEDGTAKLITYFDAKKKLASDLQNALGSTADNQSYRLVAINGPAYPVGALISVANPLDLESRACILGESDLPTREPWSSFPSWSSGQTLDLQASVPAMIHGAFIKAETSVGAGFKLSRTGLFQIADLSQVFLSRAELRKMVSRPECQSALAAAENGSAIFVRGIVYGQEKLTSSRTLNASLGMKTLAGPSGQFGITFDNSGAFELNESQSAPKFAIVAMVSTPKTTWGELKGAPDLLDAALDSMSASFKAPDDALIARLEGAAAPQ